LQQGIASTYQLRGLFGECRLAMGVGMAAASLIKLRRRIPPIMHLEGLGKDGRDYDMYKTL
jgi:hypothetical protein